MYKMMSARELRILTRTLKFATDSNFQNLEETFHIPSLVNNEGIETKTSIWMEPTDRTDEYILMIQRSEKSLCEAQGIPFEKIPEDMERVIYGFLKDSNTIRIRMLLPSPFPIRAPQFRLISATKSMGPIEQILNRMNCDLNVEYSPALAIEKTILILLSRILEGMGWV